MKLVNNNKKYWEFIRILRNDPDIQIGFIDNVHITTTDQNKYMKKYNDCYYICLRNKIPIGYVGEIDDDIRVAVIKKFQNMGVGQFMIDEFMKHKPDSKAKVKVTNKASNKLFTKCGFSLIKKEKGFNYYKKEL